MEINYCNKCGKNLDDLWVNVMLVTYVTRQREDGISEKVENSHIETKEILCPSCFEKFCEIIEKGMNFDV